MSRRERIGGVPLYQFENGLQFRRLLSVASRERAGVQVDRRDATVATLPGRRVFALVSPQIEDLPELALVVVVVDPIPPRRLPHYRFDPRSDLYVGNMGVFLPDSDWLEAHTGGDQKSYAEMVRQIDPLLKTYPRAVLTALFGWLGLPTGNIGHSSRRRLRIPIVDHLQPFRVTNTSEEIQTLMSAELVTADAMERFLGQAQVLKPFSSNVDKRRDPKRPKRWRLKRHRVLVEANVDRERARWRVGLRRPGPTVGREFRDLKLRKTGWWPTLIDALVDAGFAVDSSDWPEWLDAHRLPGHPLIDISSYHLLGIQPPPLMDNTELRAWLDAISD